MCDTNGNLSPTQMGISQLQNGQSIRHLIFRVKEINTKIETIFNDWYGYFSINRQHNYQLICFNFRIVILKPNLGTDILNTFCQLVLSRMPHNSNISSSKFYFQLITTIKQEQKHFVDIRKHWSIAAFCQWSPGKLCKAHQTGNLIDSSTYRWLSDRLQ